MSYQKPIYIISHNGKYKTNKTNVARLWEVFKKHWGEKPLQISYQADEKDTEYTTINGISNYVKPTCKKAVRNRILVHPVDSMDDCMAVFFDSVGGIEENETEEKDNVN